MGGRLSKEEIERMVNDAEKFKADDEKQKDRISAKNGLESYCFNMKTTLDDEKVKERSPRTIARPSAISVTKQLSGWTPTSWPRSRSSMLSKRKWRLCAIRSLPSCMLMPVELAVCPEVCQTWEVWAVCQVALELLLVLEVLDLPSRKLIKSHLPSLKLTQLLLSAFKLAIFLVLATCNM